MDKVRGCFGSCPVLRSSIFSENDSITIISRFWLNRSTSIFISRHSLFIRARSFFCFLMRFVIYKGQSKPVYFFIYVYIYFFLLKETNSLLLFTSVQPLISSQLCNWRIVISLTLFVWVIRMLLACFINLGVGWVCCTLGVKRCSKITWGCWWSQS